MSLENSEPTTTDEQDEMQRRLPRTVKELLALSNDDPAPDHIVEQARKIKELALLSFGGDHSVVASAIYTKCYHHVPTRTIPTLAVTTLADHSAVFLYNPDFVIRLGEEGMKFGLFHEARHLIYRHLFTFGSAQNKKNPHLWMLAQEIGINHETMERLQTGMPMLYEIDENGERITDEHGIVKRTKFEGVDPQKHYSAYRDDLIEQGIEPVSFEEFVATDTDTFRELERMANPPQDPNEICFRLTDGDEGDGDSSDGSMGIPTNEETDASITKEALRQAIRKAVGGSEHARKEVLGIAERTEGLSEEISQMWGDLGLGRLRGQSLATRRVDWWHQWVNDHLASRLKEGDRLIYSKKRGAVDMWLGNDPMLSHRGDEEEKVLVVAIDTSGSMPDHVLEYLTKLVGSTPGITFRWVAFDGVVEPFVPGEAVSGGGGTNFGHVMDYVEGRLEVDGAKLDVHPDAVLMVTDGYAPPIYPAEPEKWVWLITEGGTDHWLQTHKPEMAFHKIITGDGVN